MLEDLQRLKHPPCADFTAGLAAAAGAEYLDALFLKDQQVFLGAGVRPHLLIHGRSDGDGGAGGQAEGGEQIVAMAMSQTRHEVG